MAVTLHAGLVAHWPFDGDFTDATANGHDLGIASGVPTFAAPAPGFAGSSASFDGVSQLTEALSTPLSLGSAYSFAAWVRAPLPVSAWPGVFSLGRAGIGSDIEVYLQQGNFDLIVAHNRNTGGFDFVGVDQPLDNIWVHVAVVYDGANMTVYQNGVVQGLVQGNAAMTTPSMSSPQTVSIGKLNHNSFAPNFFVGLVDEARLYDHALNPVEVAALLVPPEDEVADPPVAVCQDITVSLDPTGTATIAAADVDGGSFDPDPGDTITLSIDVGAFTCADLGDSAVVLTVTDATGLTDTCTAVVTVGSAGPPIAHWRFDGDFLDSSGNDYDLASAAGDPAFGPPAPGFAGNSASFTGADQLTHAVGTALDLQAEYTVAAWIKAPLPQSTGYHGLFSIGPASAGSDIELYVQRDSNHIVVAHNRGNGGLFDYAGVMPPADQAWMHVAAVYDSGVLKVYYDGVLLGSFTQNNALMASPTMSSPQTISVGKLSHSLFNPNFFNGLVDELMLYDRALSAEEVVDVMTAETNSLPVAVCADVTVDLDGAGSASIVPADVDGGSYDTDTGDVITLSIDIDTFSSVSPCDNTVVLTATDGGCASDTCEAAVTVIDCAAIEADVLAAACTGLAGTAAFAEARAALSQAIDGAFAARGCAAVDPTCRDAILQAFDDLVVQALQP